MANRTKRTPKKDEKFLSHLAATADVTASARAAGYSRRSVYEWKEKDEAWHGMAAGRRPGAWVSMP